MFRKSDTLCSLWEIIAWFIKESHISAANTKKYGMKMPHIAYFGVCRKYLFKDRRLFLCFKNGLILNSFPRDYCFFWSKCFISEKLKEFCVKRTSYSFFITQRAGKTQFLPFIYAFYCKKTILKVLIQVISTEEVASLGI